MARPRTKVVKDKETKALKTLLSRETTDTVVNLDTTSYLERKKGTSKIVIHRDGRILDLEEATIKDFEHLYVKGFFENVKNAENLQIDKSLFYTDEQIHKLSRQGILSLGDAITNKHCDVCPIKVNKDSNITLANYCILSCEVGIELQLVGAVFEQRGRCRIDRGKRTKTNTEENVRNSRIDNNDLTKKEIKNTREQILQRRLKSIKSIYSKLVSPKSVPTAEETVVEN